MSLDDFPPPTWHRNRSYHTGTWRGGAWPEILGGKQQGSSRGTDPEKEGVP